MGPEQGPPASANGGAEETFRKGTQLQAIALMTGLRELREQGRLLDACLTDAAGESKHAVHQVVLAAASVPLRKYLAHAVGNADSQDMEETQKCGLSAAPHPQEIRVSGGGETGKGLSQILGYLYGTSGLAEFNDGAEELRTVWQVPSSPSPDALGLAAGLSDLRAAGLLCDVALSAGGKNFRAHQAVLAAASKPLRAYFFDKLQEHVGQDVLKTPGDEGFVVSSQPMQLDLEGVASAEAVAFVLDFVYGRTPTLQVSKVSVAKDIQQLAASLELPHLGPIAAKLLPSAVPQRAPRPPAAQAPAAPPAAQAPAAPQAPPLTVVAQTVLAAPVPAAKKIDDSHDIAAAGAAIAPRTAAEQAPAPQQTVSRRRTPAPRALFTDKMSKLEQEEQTEAPVQKKKTAVPEDLAAAAESLGTTDLERALYAMHFCGFADSGVPADSKAGPPPAGKKEAKMLERLRDVFAERRVWLRDPLLKALPNSFTEDVLTMLLPFVAYQWTDGPWQQAFTVLGWDPRQNSTESMKLQVVEFRDPFLRTKKGAAFLSDAPIDCTFRKPPTSKVAHYQLEDIQDSFLAALLDGADHTEACSKKAGWLPEWTVDAAKDRMAVKSKELREKAAAKEAAQAESQGKKRASADGKRPSAGGEAAGRAAKRTRAAGA